MVLKLANVNIVIIRGGRVRNFAVYRIQVLGS